jgi:hypothetical protein
MRKQVSIKLGEASPHDLDKVVATYEKTKATGLPYTVEFAEGTDSGSMFYFHVYRDETDEEHERSQLRLRRERKKLRDRLKKARLEKVSL